MAEPGDTRRPKDGLIQNYLAIDYTKSKFSADMHNNDYFRSYFPFNNM